MILKDLKFLYKVLDSYYLIYINLSNPMGNTTLIKY